jgi:hypothetical protein
VDKAKSIRKRIRMDATSTESENNKIKIASGRFYEIKDKAQSRRKENKGDQHGTYGSIELHKIPRNSRTMLSWIISVTTFNRENALESSGKWNGKTTLNLLTDQNNNDSRIV